MLAQKRNQPACSDVIADAEPGFCGPSGVTAEIAAEEADS